MKIAIIGDTHYSSITRPNALFQIQEIIADINLWAPDLVVQIGDLVDYGWTSGGDTPYVEYDDIFPEFSNLDAPVFHVLGNHEYEEFYQEGSSDAREQWLATTGYDSTYYSTDVAGYHVVVLDANYNADGTDYPTAWHNANVSPDQLSWLAADLNATLLPALIFCHQRMDEDKFPTTPPTEGKWIDNGMAVRTILQNSGKVEAVFCGHDHSLDKRLSYEIDHYSVYAPRNDSYPIWKYNRVTLDDDGEVTFQLKTNSGLDGIYTPTTPPTKVVDRSTTTIIGTLLVR